MADELYKNAAFFAERLLAECNFEEVKILLGDSYSGELNS